MRDRTTVVPRSLGGLRLRLTAWYAATLLVILALVGIGLFAMATQRIDADLDDSLRGAADAMAKVVTAKGPEAASSYLSTPDRRLILFDSVGTAIGQPDVDTWLRELARTAVARGRGESRSHHLDDDRILRAFAQPVRTNDGRTFATMAVGDEIEIEDKYRAFIGAAITAALVALVLVAFGGWFIAAKSIAPVDRAVEQMRRFMADAAHELRTPLTVVRGRAEVALQRERDVPEYVDTLRGIERESIRVGRIIEDLLMLARADTGERPIERQRVFLDDIMLDSAEAAKALGSKREVKISIAEFEEAPIVGDPVLVHQLVMILLDNAIKFSPNGAVVEVGVWRAGDTATVSVTDSGPGIPADQLPHVFDRFYRGDAARSRAGTAASEGAGLGLSIAQWITEQHGATIRIDSTVGKGTTVIVVFPPALDAGAS